MKLTNIFLCIFTFYPITSFAAESYRDISGKALIGLVIIGFFAIFGGNGARRIIFFLFLSFATAGFCGYVGFQVGGPIGLLIGSCLGLFIFYKIYESNLT